VDLILGLLFPTEGRILLDETPLDRDTVRAWHRSVGYVPQAIYLADASVAENIAFGVEPAEIDREAVERAARVAAIHEFVTQELPRGYDTVVGERGMRLSGGQRQRIGIARALYHDPDVLVLDEATSALDTGTERAIMESVERLSGEKTIIMIAHRLTTVEGSDLIVVLDQGEVKGQGRS
jgi:ATP-binding cassette, subfamily B, bacterial PglK